MSSPHIDDTIRSILAEHGHLSRPIDQVGDGDDLYHLDLTSHSSVDVMLALEDAFEFEFPNQLLRRATFETIANIRDAVRTIVDAGLGE